MSLLSIVHVTFLRNESSHAPSQSSGRPCPGRISCWIHNLHLVNFIRMALASLCCGMNMDQSRERHACSKWLDKRGMCSSRTSLVKGP